MEKKHDAQLHFIQIYCDVAFLYYCILLYVCIYSLTTLYLLASYLYGYLIKLTFYLQNCSNNELSYLFPPAEGVTDWWLIHNDFDFLVKQNSKFSVPPPIVYFLLIPYIKY